MAYEEITALLGGWPGFVLVAVFAVAFLGERPAAREWAGIGPVALGVLVLSVRR